MFICVNAERARLAASKINRGTHPHLYLSMAEDLFAAHPSLMGRHLDSLVIAEIDGCRRPCLSLTGYDFAPQNIYGPAIPRSVMAPGLAFELLALAYSVILRNRAKDTVRSASCYLLANGERIHMQHDFIRAAAAKHKWPRKLSPPALAQLSSLIEAHAGPAFDRKIPGAARSLHMSKARTAAAYAMWAGHFGARPTVQEEDGLAMPQGATA